MSINTKWLGHHGSRLRASGKLNYERVLSLVSTSNHIAFSSGISAPIRNPGWGLAISRNFKVTVISKLLPFE